jgi:hypothetical protein
MPGQAKLKGDVERITQNGNENQTFVNLCTFLLIVLCPIQDLFLQGTPLRSLGSSPSVFPLCGIAAFVTARWLLCASMRLKRSVVICFVYVVVTGVYGFLVFGTSSHGENLFVKAATILVSLGVVMFTAFGVDYEETNLLRAAIYCAFILLVVGFCFGNSNPLGLPNIIENPILHFTPIADARPRGLSNEPSEFSITAVAIGLLATHVTRSRRVKVFLFCVTVALLVASGSKGGIFMLFLCVIILSIIKWHSKWYQIAALVLVALPMGAILIALLPTLFTEESFVTSNTVPTRVSMVFCALMTVMRHPFGVGLSGFLPAVAQYLPDAMRTTQSLIPFPLNFTEVSAYLTSAEQVSTKTFYFDQLMRFGIPFGVCFVIFVKKLVTCLLEQKQVVMSIAVLACAIAIMTYIPGTGVFAVPIVFGVALNR